MQLIKALGAQFSSANSVIYFAKIGLFSLNICHYACILRDCDVENRSGDFSHVETWSDRPDLQHML
jgi:hypothetical protein